MTASLYRKYNTFSDRESERQHRTMTFAELPNHPLLLTMIALVPTYFIVFFLDMLYSATVVKSKTDQVSYSLWISLEIKVN